MKVALEDKTFILVLTQDDEIGPVTCKSRRVNGNAFSTTVNLQTLPKDAEMHVTIKLSAASMMQFAKQAKWWKRVARKKIKS